MPQQTGELEGAWASTSCSSTTFSCYNTLHSKQSQNKPHPEASHTGAGVHQGPHVSVMCFCKKYLNPVHGVYWTVRYLDSIQVCYVWNVLTLHKFVRTDDDIKHKLAQGNHAASLPSPTHTRTELLSAHTRNPFSPSSGFSEPALKCNSSPEKWDMLLFLLPYLQSFTLFSFFFPPPFSPVVLFCPDGACSSLQRIIYLIKENLGAVWKIS